MVIQGGANDVWAVSQAGGEAGCSFKGVQYVLYMVYKTPGMKHGLQENGLFIRHVPMKSSIE